MTCAMKKFHLKVKGATVSNPFTSTGGHEVPVLDRTLEFWRKKLQRLDRKSTRLNSSHVSQSRMPSSA